MHYMVSNLILNIRKKKNCTFKNYKYLLIVKLKYLQKTEYKNEAYIY